MFFPCVLGEFARTLLRGKRMYLVPERKDVLYSECIREISCGLLRESNSILVYLGPLVST